MSCDRDEGATMAEYRAIRATAVPIDTARREHERECHPVLDEIARWVGLTLTGGTGLLLLALLAAAVVWPFAALPGMPWEKVGPFLGRVLFVALLLGMLAYLNGTILLRLALRRPPPEKLVIDPPRWVADTLGVVLAVTAVLALATGHFEAFAASMEIAGFIVGLIAIDRSGLFESKRGPGRRPGPRDCRERDSNPHGLPTPGF
jgi:hypothetical protein